MKKVFRLQTGVKRSLWDDEQKVRWKFKIQFEFGYDKVKFTPNQPISISQDKQNIAKFNKRFNHDKLYGALLTHAHIYPKEIRLKFFCLNSKLWSVLFFVLWLFIFVFLMCIQAHTHRERESIHWPIVFSVYTIHTVYYTDTHKTQTSRHRHIDTHL